MLGWLPACASEHWLTRSLPAASAFARANGWTLGRTDIAPTALGKGHTRRSALAAWRATDLDLFEHADYFLAGSRRLVGAVMHMYGPMRIEDVPDFISVEELPASWYYPNITTAYLLRPSARR